MCDVKVPGSAAPNGGQTTGAGGTDDRFNQMLARLEMIQNQTQERQFLVNEREAKHQANLAAARSRVA